MTDNAINSRDDADLQDRYVSRPSAQGAWLASWAVPVAYATLVMWLVIVNAIWFMPGDGHDTSTPPLLMHLTRLSWVGAVFLVLMSFLTRRASITLAPLLYFFPFVILAIISAVLAANHYEAGRAVVLWVLGVLAAGAIASFLGVREIHRVILVVATIAIVVSLVLAVVSPSNAWHRALGGQALRGMFPHKNALGWFCFLMVQWTLFGPHQTTLLRRLVIGTLLLGIIVISRSQTSLMMATLCSGFGVWLILVRRSGTPGWVQMILTIGLCGGLYIAQSVLLPIVLHAIGRDMSFTGRDEVWQLYAQFVDLDRTLGMGPGSFSQDSFLANRIGQSLTDDSLRSAHSMYLIMLGEAGWLGLAAYISSFIYLLLVRPFANPSSGLLVPLLTLAILIAGFVESRDTFVGGSCGFLLFLMLAAETRSQFNAHMSAARAPSHAFS